MNLIDRYIEQVGENLPRKDREDILKEIRSILEDTLESRSQTENRPVDEDLIVVVLKDFGSPSKVAASYLPPRYLIGPRLYPTFFMLTKIILGIVLLVAHCHNLSRAFPTTPDHRNRHRILYQEIAECHWIDALCIRKHCLRFRHSGMGFVQSQTGK